MDAAAPREGPGAKLRTSDPGLPFLASEAALELDRLLAGCTTGLGAVHQIAERLQNAAGHRCSKSAADWQMDSATLSVLHEIFRRTTSGMAIRTADELMIAIGSVARDLLGSDPDADRERLEWARAFCVNLARSASAYRRSIDDLRPTHPSRRLCA